MASNIPETAQIRTVDPFASYNSDTVDKLTRMMTFDDNLLANVNSLRVTLDSTAANHVVVSTGSAFKDDTLIEITQEISIDFDDKDSYYDWSAGWFDEAGTYYLLLRYRYAKSRPAPVASYQILKPSQRSSFSLTGDWVFLAAVVVSWNGATFQVDSVSDYDSDTGTYPNSKRRYLTKYAGSETILPSHNQNRDQSRIAYDALNDEFWFGYSDRWERLGTASKITDTTTSWTLSGGSYYYDVDITGLGISDQEVVVSCKDTSTNMVIIPQDIDLSQANKVRIWMPVNTVSLVVTVVG